VNHVSAMPKATLMAMLETTKTVIGTVHLDPLPGAPRYAGAQMSGICEHAVRDALRYVDGGVDAVLIENDGDTPFLKPSQIGPETVAAMTAATIAVRDAVDVPVAVFCLANAVVESIAIAKASGATFVRANQWANAYVANEGFVEGAAATALRFRANVRASEVCVLADVHVKHGSHAIVADRSLEELARDVLAFDADALIVTGQRTGDAPLTDEVSAVAEVSTKPLLLGSGVTADNVASLLGTADGVIVGSSLKEGGVWWKPVSEERTLVFMRIVDEVRGASGRSHSS